MSIIMLLIYGIKGLLAPLRGNWEEAEYEPCD